MEEEEEEAAIDGVRRDASRADYTSLGNMWTSIRESRHYLAKRDQLDIS